MVRVIVDAYRQETGDMTEPGTMGGGTYARAVPNTISIGTGWLGDGEAHQTDERVAVESLKKMARIYAAILYRLATV
jgi:succinyl-diaminopimelate desuccinylase